MRTTAQLIIVAIFFACFASAQQTAPAPLAITTESLPRAVPQQKYRTKLEATGGVPPLLWSIAAGTLPSDLKLDLESGLISGTPTETGDFHFTVEVSDSAEPPHSATRELSLAAAAALSLEWSRYPGVDLDQISGALYVTNGTKDEFDQTVIILAVNEIGKAFALGYQHFKLQPDSHKVEVKFGSSLPRGTYVVHADAVAEVESKHTIYRDRLQTPQPLLVSVP